MEPAMQVISNDKTVRDDTIQDLKELNKSNSRQKRGTISVYDAGY